MPNQEIPKEVRDPLEDSLTYSPLKDLTNKENSPAVFFSNLERVRKSPSTARLYALFGGGPAKPDVIQPSPDKYPISPKRLQDFWDTPSKSGLVDRTPASPDKTKVIADLSTEVASLRSSLALVQKDCEFHRQRAVAAQDQVDHLSKYVGLLEEENKKTRRKISEGRPSVAPNEDQEKMQLLHSVESMDALNRSLARQNDLLRSRSSVTARFAKKDVKIQTEPKEMISVGTLTVEEVKCDSPVLPFMGTPIQPVVTPVTAPRRPEPIIEHHISTPTVKFSRIYIRDAESQTEAGVWATVEDAPITGTGLQLPIPSRLPAHAPEDLTLLNGEIRRRPGYPYRTAERARRSLPNYGLYPTSPAEAHRKSVPKPLLAPVARPARNQPFVPADDSPFGWRSEWRNLSSARRGKSVGAVPSQRPKWIP